MNFVSGIVRWVRVRDRAGLEDRDLVKRVNAGLEFLLGMANVAGQPEHSLTPAVHILEADDRIYRLAADGGYESIVQVFAWRDIEPTRDEWHWQQSDFAVQAADYYGLGLIIRLDHPPDWALRSDRR